MWDPQGAGTERCTEALAILESEAGRGWGWGWGWGKRRRAFDAVINVQGDEPLIDPEIIDACVVTLQVCAATSWLWVMGHGLWVTGWG